MSNTLEEILINYLHDNGCEFTKVNTLLFAIHDGGANVLAQMMISKYLREPQHCTKELYPHYSSYVDLVVPKLQRFTKAKYKFCKLPRDVKTQRLIAQQLLIEVQELITRGYGIKTDPWSCKLDTVMFNEMLSLNYCFVIFNGEVDEKDIDREEAITSVFSADDIVVEGFKFVLLKPQSSADMIKFNNVTKGLTVLNYKTVCDQLGISDPK